MIEGSMKRNSKSNWLQNPRARMFSQKKKKKLNKTKQQKTNKQKTIYAAVTRLYMELDSIEKCFHLRNVSVGFSMSHMFIWFVPHMGTIWRGFSKLK